jgi:hypothetical protein
MGTGNRRTLVIASRVHHSPEDWDYQAGKEFHLSAVRYISSPTALCLPVSLGGGGDGWVFLKEAVSGNLTEGRIINNVYTTVGTGRHIIYFFRAQAEPAGDKPANCYYLDRAVTYSTLYKIVDGKATIIKSGTGSNFIINAWNKHRLTWYIWLTETLQPVLRVIFDDWVDGAWLNQLTYDTASPLWQDTPTNLIGMAMCYSSLSTKSWVDDTEIYRRA